MKQIKKQAGFTLIELIMVIVILGVLSAFALPRFADLGKEARVASLQGVAGSIKAASAIAHSKWLVGNDATAVTIDLEGVNGVTMLNGYPTAFDTGITAAAQINAGASLDVAEFIKEGGADAAALSIAYKLRDNCLVTYTAAVAGSPITVPTVVVTDSGC